MLEQDRPAPYPATTSAKGWRFELDYERIGQSDTWALATPPMRPWLLMLWLVAWKQVPCGSLPADDELIVARIGIDSQVFAANRRVLLRGWWLADDGRLYHDTVAERVLEMLATKGKDRARKAEYRARLASAPHPSNSVPRDTRGTDGGVRPESSTGTRTRTGTNEEHPPTPRKRGTAAQAWVSRLVEMGVDKQHAEDWLKVRTGKRLVMTDTALEKLQAEAATAGMTVGQAVKRACEEGWGGFKASWLTTQRNGQPQVDDPAAWWRTKSGILTHAKELRLTPPTGESVSTWMDFVAMVWFTAGDGPWIDETDDLVYPRFKRLQNGVA